jgi:hypothetical protein
MKCSYCHKNGHTVEKCWKKIKDDKLKTEAAEIVMLTIDEQLSFAQATLVNTDKEDNKNLFIADTGATSHMRNSLEGNV